MSREGWAKKKALAGGDNGWAERGGYMAAKVSKLEQQFKLDAPREKQKQGICSSIFTGVAIYVNGYTDPSADELRRLMMLHGGQFHVYYSRSITTHIIANNLPNNKIKELKGEKVIRPEWITDSVKAGHLLPYLRYQLYSKSKGTLFPVKTLEIAGPSHGPPHPSVHQKLHLPERTAQHRRDPSSSRPQSDASATTPGRGQRCQDNLQPQSIQRGSAACHVHPKPSHSASIDPRPAGPWHTHPLSDPSPTKPPQSTPQTPHCNLQRHRAGQPRRQSDASCHACPNGGKGVEFKVNGFVQAPSNANRTDTTRCSGGDHAQVAKEAPLANGHAHLANGALKPEYVSAVADGPPDDKELSGCSVRSPGVKPRCSQGHFESKPDPYEFPHSPPKQPEPLVFPRQTGPQGADEHRAKPPPPANQESQKSTETRQIPKQPQQPPLRGDPQPEKPPLSLASDSLLHSPLRMNGGHHNGCSSDPASLNSSSLAVELNLPPDKTSTPTTSKSSAKLLAQTGDLISEYYSHSRLHQISTWRTGFSEYVNDLHSKRKTERGAPLPGKERLRRSVALCSPESRGTPSPSSVKSCILHVDMDCFFVSVGVRNRPDLKGKPVAVTSNRGQGRVPKRAGTNPQLEQQYYQRKWSHPHADGDDDDLGGTPSQENLDLRANGVDPEAASLSMAEIASCSYEARQAGVRNGMFFGRAKQMCPSLQSVPYDFEAYKEVALTMYETLAGYTHDIEALSCDEVLIDGSGLIAELGIDPEDLAKSIRADIKERTGCCASVGMGSNILLARLATRRAKPDGQHFLKSEQVDDFIRGLPVTSLPGVGTVMGRKLAAMSMSSCGDLQQASLAQLQKKFGPRTGQTLFRFCRGLDDRPVRYEKERKSVSAEMNYNIRFTRIDETESFLTNLSMEVQRRLQEAGLRGRRVTLKLMVRKVGAPLEPSKYGGHGVCDNLARTVMLAQSTDSGELIAAAVIKLFHAMKLQVQDLRGVGIQVQLLEGHRGDPASHRTRSIKDMLLGQGPAGAHAHNGEDHSALHERTFSTATPLSASALSPMLPPEAVPGTSNGRQACARTPRHSRKRLNLSIEVPSPSQVDRSVLEALPAELREQVEQSWSHRDGRRPSNHWSPSPQKSARFPISVPLNSRPSSPPRPPLPGPALNTPSIGTLVLQMPNQPDSLGIVLELPSFSQVDPDVFAALPKELQEELKSAYNHITVQPQSKMLEPKNPLLQLKQPGAGIGGGRVKRRYKRKNAGSPAKKGPSPIKRHKTTNSPGKTLPPLMTSRDSFNIVKTESGPSAASSKADLPEALAKFVPRPAPALAGACDLTDIKTLIREWVTTIPEPMEEDILQVVKYCTDLIEDKDLERLDLVIKYMKRIMQQSVESVWSMAFDFILDNVQLVVQQAYGSTLKIS